MEQKKEHKEIYSYIIRQTTFFLVLRIVISEILIMALHFGFRILLDQIASLFSFQITYQILTAEVFLIQVLNLLLLLTVILSWTNETYTLNPKEVIIKKGIFSSRSVTYELANLQSMTINQTFIGKLFNYGSIKLFNPVLREEVYLLNIPNPYVYGDIIQQHQPEITPLIRKQKG